MSDGVTSKNKQIFSQIEGMGYIPVIAVDDATTVEPLADIFSSNELPCMEIILSTDQAEAAINTVAKKAPNILLGAGTVLSVESAKKALDAGAKFIGTPGFNTEVIEYCVSKDIPIVPGASSTSQLDLAMKYNLHVVKFFPSEQIGGISMLESLASAYPVTFIPTGGITRENVGAYLRSKHVCAVGGSDVAPRDLLRKKNFNDIESRVKETINRMLDFDIIHLGINAGGKDDATNIANKLFALVRKPIDERSVSYFVGKEYEIMFNGLGTHGHVALGTNSLIVAMRILEARGYSFREETIRRDENNRIILAYLTQEIGGFAFHLVQK